MIFIGLVDFYDLVDFYLVDYYRFRFIAFSNVLSGRKLVDHTFKTQILNQRLECGMLCARTAKCLSFNFCFEKICQLNRNSASTSNELLVHDKNCDYVGIHDDVTPDCFDGKLSGHLGDNCDLEFKVGKLWVTDCLNETTPIRNISEVEIEMKHVCYEMHCYRGQRKVIQSYCKIELGVPFSFHTANYAGNMTWQQGFGTVFLTPTNRVKSYHLYFIFHVFLNN